MKKIIIISTILFSIVRCTNKEEEFSNPLIGNQSFLFNEIDEENLDQYYRGCASLRDFQQYAFSGFISSDINQKKKQSDLRNLYKEISKIDQLFIKILNTIEKEESNFIIKNNEKQIITQSHSPSCLVSTINLCFLQNKNKKVTFKIFKNFNKTFSDLRSESINLFVESLYPNQKNNFVDPLLMGREDDSEVVRKINDAIASSSIKQNDKEVVNNLYKKLLFEEDFESIYFKDNSMINVLTTLTSLKLKILQARNIMITTLAKVSFGSNANKTEPVIHILNNVQKGGNIELEVSMSEYNDKNLIKAEAQNGISSKIINGKTIITIKANSEKEMQLKGTVTIKDEFGIPHVYPWSKTVYLN